MRAPSGNLLAGDPAKSLPGARALDGSAGAASRSRAPAPAMPAARHGPALRLAVLAKIGVERLAKCRVPFSPTFSFVTQFVPLHAAHLAKTK